MHCITWSSHYAAGLCKCKWRLDLIHTAGTVRKESRRQVNNPLIVYILLLDLGEPRWATISLVLILVRPHGSSSDDCDSPVYILLLYCSISFRIIHLLQSSLYNTPSSGHITKKWFCWNFGEIFNPFVHWWAISCHIYYHKTWLTYLPKVLNKCLNGNI